MESPAKVPNEASANAAHTEAWKSRLGAILAVAGSAVGLGNFLRFPGQAVENGGGAFMIPYFCALLFLGIPLGWAEWTMGRYGGAHGLHSAPAILGLVGKRPFARYAGVLGLLIPFVIYTYYVVIESWCLRYAFAYATGELDLGADPTQYMEGSKAFFAATTGVEQDGVMLGSGLDPSVLVWAFVFALNFWFIARGLSRGIELVCRWGLPLMALCALVVLIRVLTLGTPNPALPEQNVASGLGFMWNPDFAKLGDFKTWLAAAGQIFFSLSVGFGVIINYASYLRQKDDIVLSSLTASATNEVFEVSFGGLITVTAAFVFLGAAGATGGTFGLGFNTLPVVFAHMGPMGRVIGTIWFSMLFLAAITSSLSMLQPVKAFLTEVLGASHRRVVILLALLTLPGSLWVIWFSKGLVALDTMDFWVGTVGIFTLALLQTVCFGWIFGIERGFEEAHRGAQMRIPNLFRFVLKYIAPTYLLVVFVGFCIQQAPAYAQQIGENAVVRNTLLVILAALTFFVVLTRRGVERWAEIQRRHGGER